jgi:hypothetical protein
MNHADSKCCFDRREEEDALRLATLRSAVQIGVADSEAGRCMLRPPLGDVIIKDLTPKTWI